MLGEALLSPQSAKSCMVPGVESARKVIAVGENVHESRIRVLKAQRATIPPKDDPR